MINTVSDKNLPIQQRKELLLKKIPRDLNKWKRDIRSGSLRKLRKLRSQMREFRVSEAPWADRIEELKNSFIVLEVMET